MEFILLIVVIVLWKRVNRLKRQVDPIPPPKLNEPMSLDQLIAVAAIGLAVLVIWGASYLGY